METTQKEPIRMIPVSGLQLAPEEMKKLYTRLALCQYRFLRKPDYDEVRLLRAADILKFLAEVNRLAELDTNNHTLQRISMFFDMHHKCLQQVAAQDKGSAPAPGEAIASEVGEFRG